MGAEAEQLFDQPFFQIKTARQRMNEHLNKDVVDEINAFVDSETNDMLDLVYKKITPRYKQLNREVYQHLEKVESKQDYEQCIQRFFELTDVRQVSHDIEQALKFPKLEKRYYHALQNFSKQENGNLIKAYKFDSDVFDYLTQGLYIELEEVKESLGEYAQRVKEYIELLASIRHAAGGKTFFKIVASFAGGALGGPFGSLAARGLLSAFNNDDERIQSSMVAVEEAWDYYTKTLERYLDNLKMHYQHILLSLYGGLFISVQQELAKRWLTIQELNLLHDTYTLAVHPDKQPDVQKWTLKNVRTVASHINKKELNRAKAIANEFYHYINQQPALSRQAINGSKDVLYYAQLVNGSTLLSQANRLEDKHAYIQFSEELFQQSPFLVDDEDLLKMNLSLQLDLLLDYVMACVKVDKQLDFESLLTYFERTIETLGNRHGEEAWIFEQDSDLLNLTIIISDFAKDFGIKHHKFQERSKMCLSRQLV